MEGVVPRNFKLTGGNPAPSAKELIMTYFEQSSFIGKTIKTVVHTTDGNEELRIEFTDGSTIAIVAYSSNQETGALDFSSVNPLRG